MPIGAAAAVDGEALVLRGAVLSVDGRRLVAGELSGAAAEAEDLGTRLADELRTRGAAELPASRP